MQHPMTMTIFNNGFFQVRCKPISRLFSGVRRWHMPALILQKRNCAFSFIGLYLAYP